MRKEPSNDRGLYREDDDRQASFGKCLACATQEHPFPEHGLRVNLDQWIAGVEQRNRRLAALLRGVHAIEKDGHSLTFVWQSDWHRDTGKKREKEIRAVLGAYREYALTHTSLPAIIAEDELLVFAQGLGAKIKIITEE